MVEVVAPQVGGVEAEDGSLIAADYMVDGGPSVLFDAVALVLSEQAAERLCGEATARDFVSDAFAHCKYIAFTHGALPLLQRAGIDPDMDEGLILLEDEKAIQNFTRPAQNCASGRGKLRSNWDAKRLPPAR
ncbi:hypothetical protein [Brucella pituitosa]|uniref:hypothetical protein n=1 Tax=Brucella pituitosa TaxID=571256 RepID=UPI0020925065|nr:hypothetical protein [Brucella pituitosa]